MSELRQILTAVEAGDPAARETLFLRFYPRVRDMVHRQLQHDFRKNHRWILPLFSTGDIVQEVFLGVIHSQIDGFTGDEEEAFVQFLGAICRNRLLDALRFHEAGRRDVRRHADLPTQAAAALTPPNDDPTPSLAASIGEQMAIYREVLESLAPNQKRVLELRLEDETPFARIAEIMGNASADAARQAFRLAKARLLVRLRERGIQPPEDLA